MICEDVFLKYCGQTASCGKFLILASVLRSSDRFLAYCKYRNQGVFQFLGYPLIFINADASCGRIEQDVYCNGYGDYQIMGQLFSEQYFRHGSSEQNLKESLKGEWREQKVIDDGTALRRRWLRDVAAVGGGVRQN
jgi:hypothetical protein